MKLFRLSNIVIIFLFLLCILTGFRLINSKKVISGLDEKINFLSSNIELYSDFSCHYVFRNDFSLKLITDNGMLRDTLLKDIVKNNKKVVLYIDNLQCSSCVEDAILKIKKTESKYNKDCMIITYGYNNRDLQILIKEEGITSPIFILNEDSRFFLEMQKSIRPFYFVLDNNLLASKIFFPNKKDEKIEERYFKRIFVND